MLINLLIIILITTNVYSYEFLSRVSCTINNKKINKIGSVCWLLENKPDIYTTENVTDHIIYVVPNTIVEIEKNVITNNILQNNISTTECRVSHGLDRIDQEKLPLDCRPFNISKTKPIKSLQKTNVFILDTGCMRDHSEFEPNSVELSRTFIGSDLGIVSNKLSWDNNGHGTHVAGIIASRTYGVAYGRVNIKCGKVLSFDGTGRLSTLLMGLKWVLNYPVSSKILNLSLNGPKNPLFDDVIEQLILNNITVVASAGNDFSDSCVNTSPNSKNLIKVGAIDQFDNRASFSSYGSCVDIGAPGTNIVSLAPELMRIERKNCLSQKKNKRIFKRCRFYNKKRNLSKTAIKTGTSMSTPFVTGYLSLLDYMGPIKFRSFLRKNAVFTNKRPILYVGTKNNNVENWNGFLK